MLRHLGENEALSLVTVCTDVLAYIVAEGDAGEYKGVILNLTEALRACLFSTLLG